MKTPILPLAALLWTAPVARAQEPDSQFPAVMRAIADRIVADYPSPAAIVIGPSKTCRPQMESALCDGPSYRDGGAAMTLAGQTLAAELRLPYSVRWSDSVRSHMSPPVFDPKATEATKYRFCAAPKGETVPYVLTIRPSVIRETAAQAEWRVLVYVNQDPLRAECLGSGSGYEYVVVRDGARDAYRVAKATWFGSGTAHIWPG